MEVRGTVDEEQQQKESRSSVIYLAIYKIQPVTGGIFWETEPLYSQPIVVSDHKTCESFYSSDLWWWSGVLLACWHIRKC